MCSPQNEPSTLIIYDPSPLQNSSENKHRIKYRIARLLPRIKIPNCANNCCLVALRIAQLIISTVTLPCLAVIGLKKVYNDIEYLESIWRLKWELVTNK